MSGDSTPGWLKWEEGESSAAVPGSQAQEAGFSCYCYKCCCPDCRDAHCLLLPLPVLCSRRSLATLRNLLLLQQPKIGVPSSPQQASSTSAASCTSAAAKKQRTLFELLRTSRSLPPRTVDIPQIGAAIVRFKKQLMR